MAKKTFRVHATMETDLYLDVKARTRDEAIEIAESAEAGTFIQDGIGSWEVYDAYVLDDDTPTNAEYDKYWTEETKDQIEEMLINMWSVIGINIPDNHKEIVQFCYEDVGDTADLTNWHSGDVAIAFRRWMESKTQ